MALIVNPQTGRLIEVPDDDPAVLAAEKANAAPPIWPALAQEARNLGASIRGGLVQGAGALRPTILGGLQSVAEQPVVAQGVSGLRAAVQGGLQGAAAAGQGVLQGVNNLGAAARSGLQSAAAAGPALVQGANDLGTTISSGVARGVNDLGATVSNGLQQGVASYGPGLADLGTIVRGGLQGVGNAVGAAVVNPLDRARALAVQSLGGDPNNLSGGNLTDQAFSLMDQGFADAGAAAGRVGSGLRSTALGLLGARDAPPAAPLVPKPVAAVPLAHPQTYVGMPDDVSGTPTPVPGPATLTAQDLAPVNVAIANGLAQMQAPAAGRNYGPGNNGINFGFGVNGAPSAQQVLARYAQQDAQARLNQNAKMDQLEIGSLMSAFNDPFAKTQDKKFIMHLLGMRTDQANKSAALAQGNNLGTMDLTGRQATAEAALANQRAIATERTQAALQAANLTGTYGLQAAQIKADATKATARSTEGTQRKANLEADAVESRNALVAGMLQRQEITPEQAAQMLGNYYLKPPQDTLTGAYIAPDNNAGLQELQRLRLREDLKKQRAKTQ